MTNTDKPPVAPVEGQQSLASRLARMTDIQKRTHKRLKKLEALIPLADAACDYADRHCRAFPIATAPRERWIEFWDASAKAWRAMWLSPYVEIDTDYYTHWRETAPPPSTPPLPAVFVELGAALERLKGA